jgi:hypothetical protein
MPVEREDWDDNRPNVTDLGYPKDKRGRYVVPKNWEPPDGFAGTVLQDGMELSYPGRMRRRKKTLAEGD